MPTLKKSTALKTNYGNRSYRIERLELISSDKRSILSKDYHIYENDQPINRYDNFGEAVYQMLIRAGQIKDPSILILTPE